MTATIDRETTLIVLRLVANGKRAVDAATLAGVDLATVRRTACEYGHPDLGRISEAIKSLQIQPKSVGPAPMQAVPAVVEHRTDPVSAQWRILETAKQSPIKSTRQIASRVEVLLADLTERINAEAAAAKAAAARERQKEQARAEIAQLEARLAAAKAAFKGEPPAAASNSEPTARMIRAWAAEHGVPCSIRGRVPQETRDAYLAAQAANAA
jgi:hypothetical protein